MLLRIQEEGSRFSQLSNYVELTSSAKWESLKGRDIYPVL